MQLRILRSGLIGPVLLATMLLESRGTAQDNVNRFIAQTPPQSAAKQQQMFHLPEGFHIELVACEPDVINPIKLCFDASGRLYFSQSVEYPFPVAEGQTGRDSVKVISDQDGNGVPETVHTFADGLNIPISITPIPGGLLGHSVPNLYKFADPDGDARANGREIAYQRFAFEDTHGMCSALSWWIDGWVYGSHGFANTSTIQGTDEEAITVNSGNTFRLRPEGTHIEQFTHGQVNPFGMSFDPLGNIFTADCHSRPITMLLRGAYYPSFSKPHDGLGFAPEMMQHSHGSTAISGCVYYAADHFPASYYDTLFVGNVVTGRVNHDRIEVHGSTYKAVEQPDFVSCDDPWFRPVDLKLGPDGALYIADFYNCIIGHYEVPLDHPQRDRKHGRIWRVSYTGESAAKESSRKPRPPRRMAEAPLDELLEALGDANLVLRTQATHELVHRIGPASVTAVRELLSGPSCAYQRAHAVWVLSRLGALDDGALHRCLQDPDPLVRVHTIKAAAERDDWKVADRRRVMAALDDQNAFVRRAAVETLARHPHEECVRPLLKLWQATPADDEMLIHAARIALRNTLRHMDDFDRAAQLAEQTADSPRMLADVCLGIPTDRAAQFLLEYCERYSWPDDKLAETIEHMGRHLLQPELSRYAGWVVTLKQENDDVQKLALLTAHRVLSGRGEPFPADLTVWADETAARLLSHSEPPVRSSGIELAGELRLKSSVPLLAQAANEEGSPPPERSSALRALVTVDRQAAEPVAVALATNSGVPDEVRRSATEGLGRLDSSRARQTLVDLLAIAPQSFAPAVARSLAQTREGCASLLASVEGGKASPHVLQDRTVEDRLRQAKLDSWQDRLKAVLDGVPPADQRLREQIAGHVKDYQAARPDPRHGAELFGKHCAACHRINEKGNKIGPELDGIGRRGLERILEDVLDPNRNVDANFRATVVVLEDGRILQGLAQREVDAQLLLIDAVGKEQRIPLAEIAERKRSRLSAMPADAADKLPVPELYHLLGFLIEQTREPADR